jgi:hypothetical protein
VRHAYFTGADEPYDKLKRALRAEDVYYWEHLGMLGTPAYRDAWARKRRWYVETLGIPVIGDDAPGMDAEPGTSPLVITSRDGDDGSIDAQRIEYLARRYILLEA